MLKLTRKAVIDFLDLTASQYDYWLLQLTSENFDTHQLTLYQTFVLQLIKRLTQEYNLSAKLLKDLGLEELLDTISSPQFIHHQLSQENQYLVVDFYLGCVHLMGPSNEGSHAHSGPVLDLRREWKLFDQQIYF
ncbi:MAG: hypothetical protein R3309_08850 [Reinekea sp.]|nr:hypothetical protein [Reinekea sp.]